MDILQIIECKGYTKEEAFAHLEFNPNDAIVPGTNATQSWIKAGSPIPGTLDFKRFITQQLEEKTKMKPGYGIYIILDPPIPDKRKRPYTIVNNKTIGTREWNLVYQIREDSLALEKLPEFETNYDGENELSGEQVNIAVSKPGLIIAQANSKSEAIDIAKELTTQTHKNYSIIPVKIPDLTPIAAYCVYTPSKSAKVGTFIACGVNR